MALVKERKGRETTMPLPPSWLASQPSSGTHDKRQMQRLVNGSMDRVIDEARRTLLAIIERLYAVFARYPLNTDMDACPCGCISAEDKQRVYSKALRLVGPHDLNTYAAKALTTWGGPADFKHFLPRICELVVIDPNHLPDVEVLFLRLTLAQWQEWPDKEKQAVLDYLWALWAYVIVTVDPEPLGMQVDSYLCGIGQAVDNLRPFLEMWQGTQHGVAMQNLAGFVNGDASFINKHHRMGNAFWANRPAQMQQVLDWLLDPGTRMSLEEKALAHIDDDLFVPLASAVDALRLVQ